MTPAPPSAPVPSTPEPAPREASPEPAPGEDPARFAEAERLLDRALALEGFYPFPRDLAARIVEDALGAPRLTVGALAVRVAAAVVLAIAAWGALVGRAPADPRADALPAWVEAPVSLPGEHALAAAPAVPAPAAPWVLAGALGLVVGGVVLARRWGTGLAPAREGGAA